MSIYETGPEDTGADESISIDVVEAVADYVGKDPVELPPLHDSVDPEALDGLFKQRPQGGRRSGVVRFTCHEFIITVSCDAKTTIILDCRT